MNPGEWERQKSANLFKVQILKAKSTIRKGNLTSNYIQN